MFRRPDDLLFAIGAEIAKMHLADVVHGDLTTSNMMVRLLPRDASESVQKEHRESGAVPFEVVSTASALTPAPTLTSANAGPDRLWALLERNRPRRPCG